MLKVILSRIRQGHRTMKYPAGAPPELPDRFHGLPVINPGECPEGCRECLEACPTSAVTRAPDLRIDLGRCLFCTDCERVCPAKAIAFTQDYRLAAGQRQDLVLAGDGTELRRAEVLGRRLVRLLGRSLKLRQVSAGGCNACEADVNVLNTVGWDLGRFGIQFVAAPRHADGLLITGPVSKNMELALRKTWEAVPEPKIVIAVGSCAVSGGPYLDHPEVCNGAGSIVPVDLWIPGCPPHPLTILDGLLRILGRVKD